MHEKIHTECLILHMYERKEADKLFHVFSREYGLLYAEGRGVRKQDSKLRGLLQELSRVKCSLVYTRNGWKITNADFVSNLIFDNSLTIPQLDMFKRFFSLLKKIGGEEDTRVLYDTLIHTFRYIQIHTVDEDELGELEVLLALRLLHNFGYLGNTGYFKYLLASPFMHDMFLGETRRVKKHAIREINRAIRSVG